MQKQILVIEDDEILNAGLCYNLQKRDMLPFSAGSIEEAKKLLKQETFDLILLDINLPDGSGFDFAKETVAHQNIPFLFLTAHNLEEEMIQGLRTGADDYITKPFKMPILHRRIQAALRKSGKKETDARYDDGYLKIDFDSLTAVRNGQALVLTPLEYKILRLLTANADKVLTKQLLLEKIWDSSGNFVDEHAVAVNISRLRKKIESEGYSCIKTLYGMGYQWTGGKKARQE